MKQMILIVAFFLLLIVVLAAGGGDFKPNARRTLADQGFTQVNLTGFEWFGCGRDDTYNTGFEAVSLNGHKVRGVVCSGIGKGMTVRTF